MKYRRRNISMHISYCVCFGGNREPRGRRKNYLTSKLSLRDACVTVESRIMAISRFGRQEKVMFYNLTISLNETKNYFPIKPFLPNCTKKFEITEI